MSLELEIQRIIEEKFAQLNRPDLIRTPIVAFASAQDPRYEELKTIIGPWHCLPTDFLPEAQTVISYFIPFTKEVALAPKNEPDGSPVWSEAYILINQHFHVVNQAVQDYLEAQGHQAAQIRPPQGLRPGDLPRHLVPSLYRCHCESCHPGCQQSGHHGKGQRRSVL